MNKKFWVDTGDIYARDNQELKMFVMKEIEGFFNSKYHAEYEDWNWKRFPLVAVNVRLVVAGYPSSSYIPPSLAECGRKISFAEMQRIVSRAKLSEQIKQNMEYDEELL